MSVKGSYEDRLLRVITYIHDNIDGDLSLDVLADVACMSRFHWHRVFRAMTGETVAEAVRRIRLHKASLQLVGTDDAISLVADRSGYPNVASFTRAFTAAQGIPPGAFREHGEAQRLKLLRTNGADNMYPVKIETYPELMLAATAHTGPYPEIGGAFERVTRLFMSRNFMDQWAGMAGVYHDDPDLVPVANLRSHAGVILARPDAFPRDIEGLEVFPIAAGRYAVMEHKGPYTTLHDAYRWFYGTWLPQSNVEPRDLPPVEIYLNNPAEEAPENLRTDIRVPIV